MRAPVFVAMAAVAILSAGCGPTVDLTQNLEVLDVATGWFDAGIVNGQNKLVPSVTFKLRNGSDQKLVTLQVNALFRRVSEADEWGSGFLTVAGSDGLAAGATTDAITIKSHLGYTGTEARHEMLQNSLFVDAKVELFAKYGSIQWQRVGDYPIERLLINP
jgi:hypothetical protein